MRSGLSPACTRYAKGTPSIIAPTTSPAGRVSRYGEVWFRKGNDQRPVVPVRYSTQEDIVWLFGPNHCRLLIVTFTAPVFRSVLRVAEFGQPR